MRAEDALRKIGLLRRVRIENGAAAPEADTAARLAKALMERYAIKAEDIPTRSQAPAFRLTWTYWQELLNEFGLQLRRFGHRGNAAVGTDKIVYIRLRTGQWWIEERSPGGSQTSVRDWGVETLREYLSTHASKGLLAFQAMTGWPLSPRLCRLLRQAPDSRNKPDPADNCLDLSGT